MDIIINADRLEPPPNILTQNPTLPPLVQLMKSLGFPESAPPIADFLRQVYQLEGEWLVCEPVYWEAGNNDAVIVADGRMLQLTDKQSRALFQQVETFLGEEGFSLHYHNAYTWLIRVDGRPKLNSLPTHAMLHRSMMALLRDIDPTLYWVTVMTELQMFLKSNEALSQPINGFWFYGDAAFHFKDNQCLWTDNAQFIAAFPKHVKALDFDRSWDKSDILWIEKDKLLVIDCGARWFWNNMTYVTSKKSWWRNWF